MSSSRSRLRRPLETLVLSAPPLPLGGPTPDLRLPALVVQAISNTLLQRLGDLRAAGVTPVIVFDGARMPAKQETHLFRAACVLMCSLDVLPLCRMCCRCAAVCCRCTAVCCRSVAVLPPLTFVHAIQQATPRCVCEAAASQGERRLWCAGPAARQGHSDLATAHARRASGSSGSWTSVCCFAVRGRCPVCLLEPARRRLRRGCHHGGQRFGGFRCYHGTQRGCGCGACLPLTPTPTLLCTLGCQVLHHVDTKTWKAHEFDVAAALQRGRLRGLSRDLVGYHRQHTQQRCNAYCTPCGSQWLLTATPLLLTQVLCVCILSGCDYLPKQVAPGRPCDAVRGFGQGRALNLVQQGFINYPADVLGHITGNRGLQHGPHFRERFQDAILGFRHHVVWDHRAQVRGPTLWCCSRPWRGVCLCIGMVHFVTPALCGRMLVVHTSSGRCICRHCSTPLLPLPQGHVARLSTTPRLRSNMHMERIWCPAT